MTQLSFTTEWCQHCDTEVKLPNVLGIYCCPNCNEPIISCSVCKAMKCADCKLSKLTECRKGYEKKLNGLIKKYVG